MGDPRREYERRDRYQDPPAGDRPDHLLERESERGHEQHQRGQAEDRDRHGEDRPILAFGGTEPEVRPEPGEEHHERAHDSNGERYTHPQNTRRYQRYGGNQCHRERRRVGEPLGVVSGGAQQPGPEPPRHDCDDECSE